MFYLDITASELTGGSVLQCKKREADVGWKKFDSETQKMEKESN